VTSEKRANTRFVAKCESGSVDAYMTSQMASGRFNNAQRSEMAASGMGARTLRATGGLLHSLVGAGTSCEVEVS
jgi:hypothetical protein